MTAKRGEGETPSPNRRKNDLFLRAARREAVERVPVWYMRQAGRYDPMYHALKGERDLLAASRDVETAVRITLLPVDRLGVDAAILYADILTPLAGVGFDVRFVEGRGPVLDPPVRAEGDVARLRAFAPERVSFVGETLSVLREAPVPVIGFAGAPFTVASYLLEGGATREFRRTKAAYLSAPSFWRELQESLVNLTVDYLTYQARSGADALMLFDSWAGALSPWDYGRYVLPYVRQLLEGLRRDNPGHVLIYYPGVSSGELLPLLSDLTVDVLGVDWRVSLADAATRTGGRFVLQGNYDPSWLFAPEEILEAYAVRVLEEGERAPGHIFNVGHGLFPEVDVKKLKYLTDFVRTTSAARKRAQAKGGTL